MKRQFYDVTPDLAGGAMLHRNRIAVSSFLFWASFWLAWLCLAFPPFRYLAMSVPFMMLLAVIIDKGMVVKDEVYPFLIVLFAGLVLGPITKADGWKDMLFMIAGISVVFMKQLPTVRLWLVFGSWFVGFVFLYGLVGAFTGAIQFDVTSSKSSFEGTYGFVFPLLAPFALRHKRYTLAILCAVLAVLTLKRIALLAMFAACFFVLLGERRGKWLLNPPVMLVANAVVLVLNCMYALGMFDDLIFQFTGQSANQFGMGRKALQVYVVEDLINSPWQSLMGRGLGAVYLISENNVLYEKVNLHSDLLKLCYEIGFVMTAVVICTMYSSKHYMTRVGYVFINVLFFTDNTLIYYFFLFYFMLFLRLEREGRLNA